MRSLVRSWPVAVLLAFLLAPACALAQTPPPPDVPDSVALHPGPWGFDGKLAASLAQSAYTSNWRGGDTGSFAWTVRGEFSGERQFSRGFNWRNTLIVGYGQTAQQQRQPNTDSRTWEEPAKSSDLIAFGSLARWTSTNFLQPYVAFLAESQFLDQSSPIGTIKLNPIRLKESAGFAHVFIKTEKQEFITRVGVGVRETIAKSFVDPVTAATASFVATDGGLEWETTLKKPLLQERAVWRSRLAVFESLVYSKSDALETYDENVTAIDPTHTEVADYWRAPDVDWANVFSTQVTKVLSVDLVLHLIYDKFDTAANVDNSLPLDTVLRPEIERNTRLAGQFKQSLALGLNFALF
jgi:hypothetical protein